MQTAVDFLLTWMTHNQYFIGNDLLNAFEQAKKMERQQIEMAWDEKCIEGSISFEIDNRTSEEYYNDTYKK